ncbi:transposase [Akkermansiaceae bacterium]|nr:transposase [Akkermansiaceae bacterium]MDB4566679.1 transposase [Akkermansiaceae bacterium]MDB4680744.1 transposase [Akkermansiaceae bacterium]
MGYVNRAGEKAALVVVTDLLDPKAHPAEELANLYMERWQIKLKFRDLKTTLGMEHLAVKTPEMARKTIRLMQIAYNLLRIVIQRSTREAGERVNHLSVKGIITCLTSGHESFRAVAGKPRKRSELYRKSINDCAGHTLELRPYRQEPRAIKRRPKNYQMLTKHRHLFKEIPHREYHYRKPKKPA